jgi:hypothetical protein
MYSKNREDFITIELAAGKNLKVIKLGSLFYEAGKGGPNNCQKYLKVMNLLQEDRLQSGWCRTPFVQA